MKSRAVTISLPPAVALGGVARAEPPGQDWIVTDKVISLLEQRGDTRITAIEADDGRREGKGIQNGRPCAWQVDPHSDKISKTERDEDDNGARGFARCR